MSKSKKGGQFFEIPKDALDYEEGKRNCVVELKTDKGRFWVSKPVSKDSEQHIDFDKKK